MFQKRLFLFLSLFLLVIALPYKGYAHKLPLQITFVPASFEKGKGDVFLVITIEKGWKLYAPAHPEDSLSYSPILSWEDSQNLHGAQPSWPDSLKMQTGDLEGHIYKNAVIVPLTLTAQDAKKPLLLKGKLQGLICSEKACQPIQIPLELTLTPLSVFKNPEEQIRKILEGVAAPLPTAKEGVSLGTILLFALLGGLLLNVMPCVLPVLGIKLMVFTKTKASPQGGFPVGELWMTVGGIYTTFIAFAFLTLILKGLGETIGWGIHFQNPYFLSFMIVILILFTANMLGFFEVAAPSWIGGFTSFSRLKRWKSFFSGILSVLLATPCAAPFVGTAVGFALARQPFDIFSVFAALATGFSSPYWITALLPSHKLPLPKPGPWLLTFQRLLGVLLMGTISWLVFLLTTHYSYLFLGLIVGLILLIFLSFAGLHREWKSAYPILGLSLFLLLLSPLLPHYFSLTSFATELTLEESVWKPFEPHTIATQVARGQVVFVDLTATWCLTCHMNKQLVLQTSSIKALLDQPHTIRMRGDWTTPNPDIPAFLARFQKAGIPFNIVFGPNAPEGIVLPEILTITDVTNAIIHARGSS